MNQEEQYRNREIDDKFETVHQRFNEQDKTLKEILEQTKKTNGRVGTLESYQNFIKGALAILTALVLPILLFLIYQWLQNHK